MIRAIFPRVGDSFDRFLYLWLHLASSSPAVRSTLAGLFAQSRPSL